MKPEVGMYVRTIHGIKKVEEFICGQDIRFDNTKGLDEDLRKHHDYDGISINDNYFWENETIGKPSYNIIDLIKVGDYVNGQYVVQIDKDTGWIFTEQTYYDDKSGEERHYCYNTREIKTIVTKEQFKNMEYRIGD